MDTISCLGIPMSPQAISKKYKRQSLGMRKASPSSSTKISGHLSRHYFYCFIYYVLFLERQLFCFQFCFVFFAVVYCWILAYLFWRETHSVFIAQNTLVFTLIVLYVFTTASTGFNSCFPLAFCLEIVGFLHLYMIIYIFLDEYLL